MDKRATVLREPGRSRLRLALHALLVATPAAASLQADPLAFPRAYRDPADQEVAAFLASGLAYGRVSAFRPVIGALLAQADRAGGPAAWVRAFDQADAASVAHLQYRWMRGSDLALCCATLGAALRTHGRLGAIVEAGFRPAHRDVGPALEHLVLTLRELALPAAALLGRPAPSFAALPRGFRYFLPRPSDGSACKRLCMLARWMVRPPGEAGRCDGVDLGLWALPPARLVIPLDTHVARLSYLLGLTHRTDGSWRTAVEITRNLAHLDADDPVRFDFALAHLGIGGGCTVRREGDQAPPLSVCTACPLGTSCRVGAPRLRRAAVQPTVAG